LAGIIPVRTVFVVIPVRTIFVVIPVPVTMWSIMMFIPIFMTAIIIVRIYNTTG